MKKHYIVYAYLLNEKAVYVGHTNNLKERDWSHSHYSKTKEFKIPFHRFMAEAGGREKFSLRILSKLKTEKQAIRVENRMMKSLKTLYKFGGFNFCPAFLKFDNSITHDAWKAALSAAWSVKRKKKTSNRMKNDNPSHRDDVRNKISETVRNNWKDPDLRRSMLQNNRRCTGRKMSQDQRKRLSEHMKKLWTNRRKAGIVGILGSDTSAVVVV